MRLCLRVSESLVLVWRVIDWSVARVTVPSSLHAGTAKASEQASRRASASKKLPVVNNYLKLSRSARKPARLEEATVRATKEAFAVMLLRCQKVREDVRNRLGDLGLPVIHEDGQEADPVMASKLRSGQAQFVISTDSDLCVHTSAQGRPAVWVYVPLITRCNACPFALIPSVARELLFPGARNAVCVCGCARS
jgi:hypothetical protein